MCGVCVYVCGMCVCVCGGGGGVGGDGKGRITAVKLPSLKI